MTSKLCKIVCFDQESVTDYVQIVKEGNLESTTELLEDMNKEANAEAGAEGKAGISGIFKALLGLDGSVHGNASAGASFSSDKMVKNIVKNTILTDFLSVLDEASTSKAVSKTNAGAIKKFTGYKISVEKDSLSYMVMVSPYLAMFKPGSTISAGEYDIAIEKLDSVLKKAKGYYEFVGKKGNSEVVLRFNINSFKNGYTISDLLKMDLCIYAIKVGKTTLEKLNVNQELDIDVTITEKDNPSYEEKNTVTIDDKSKDKPLDVFDVLLAGVESDG